MCHAFPEAENGMRNLIVGIGNAMRGDDAAGLIAARMVCGDDVEVIELESNILSLLDLWDGYDTVILIDAVSSGAPRGTIHCWDVRNDRIPFEMFACSTHQFSVAETIELGKILDNLPRSLWIVGIETGEGAMRMGQ